MKPEVKLMWATPDPEYQIVRAARICYGGENKIDSKWVPTEAAHQVALNNRMTLGVPLLKVELGPNDEKLLKTIMTNQHNTCLRFASAAFNVSNISRVSSHQLVRIAHFGILQRSQRYCSEDGASFIYPEENDTFKDLTNKALQAYKDAVAAGMAEEDARYILPQSIDTRINLVSNFQGWKHMLSIRLDKHAQYETRLVAIELCKQLYELAPIVFGSDMEKIERENLCARKPT